MNSNARSTRENAPLDRQLAAGLDILNLSMDCSQTEKLLQFIVLIEKWNRVHNLTAIRDVEKMLSHHILDSLAILPYLSSKRILDVGSGAGLPGIPLAIARPALDVTLIDSNSKKAAFHQQALTDLRLNNGHSVCARVEEWHADPFDTIVSRAYSELRTFILSSQHLLTATGVLAAMKGAYPADEIAAIPDPFHVLHAHRIVVPGLYAERHLILIART
jgi:16S rRNA (guanine527-N7)-methyltransferase